MTDPDKIRLVQTCQCYPEQYDAFYGSRKVGYLRLRNGVFRVHWLDVGGETLYIDSDLAGDGEFTEDERDGSLSTARWVIAKRMDLEKKQSKR